jgi:hypothetical protein
LNRRSLGFARDDKAKADTSMESGRWIKASRQQTASNGTAAVSFVIPSEAEGSAVQRTSPGNVLWLRHTFLAGRSELGSTFSRSACSSHSMID